MVNVLKTLKLIKEQVKDYIVPSVTQISRKRDPYQVLISCILSLRTKDKTTIQASKRLFKVADKPKSMLKLTVGEIRKLIYPVGFYRNKSKVILGLSKKLLEDYSGKVPGSLDALLGLKGVGRKTANLVLGLGFGIPAICVDTHVHRISNRLGWIKTNNPEETEFALQKIIPGDKWIELNTLLVTFGQNLCFPVSPFCSKCKVRRFCKRRGVVKSR
ncbi:MAG: endonuclease III [Candidatus Omnitrophica bacterium]|jgi:endonuclease-3|nr:endonuclease III [Candidatus Omnitrophota bacterium]MDD5253314.1 endonuclease III [Candidatus Omnitrophota bacterium]